jgi:hypothetical protein
VTSWLHRLTRRSGTRAADSLATRLQGYPPYTAPHAGPPTAWTLEQARANLDYLLEQREERLQVLGALLAADGIDIRAALDGADPKSLLDSLHAWANDRWPALHDPKIAHEAVWLRSNRRDAEIAFSMVMDVALLLGELIVRRHAGYRWDLDLDEVNGRDGMESYLRPVLLLPAHGAMPAGVVLDLEAIVVHRYLHPEYRTTRLLNDWARLVEDAVSGSYEAFWTTPAANAD